MTPLAALGHALWRVLVPTAGQIIAVVFISLGVLMTIHSHPLFERLGILDSAFSTAANQFAGFFEGALSSPVTEKVVLLAFWSGIGLAVYIVCWGAYNLFVTASKEIAVGTQYANRSHWDGPWIALLLKTLTAILALAWASAFSYGLSFWSELAVSIFQQATFPAALMAVLAVLGLAAQLYSLIVIVQLLFTPWYTNSPFTLKED